MSVGGDAELDIPEKVGALKSAFAHVFSGPSGRASWSARPDHRGRSQRRLRTRSHCYVVDESRLRGRRDQDKTVKDGWGLCGVH